MTKPEHSILGGSSAERWMECPGSTLLAQLPFDLKDDDNEEWRGPGKEAHALAATCLIKGTDAWEQDCPSAEMANYVQTYVDTLRERPGVGLSFVEHRIEFPEFHPSMYSTLDHAALELDATEPYVTRVYVDDFKYGVGVVVDAERNLQLMYYAFCFLRGSKWPAHLPRVADDCPVELAIHQPRVTWRKNPQVWVTTAGEIVRWGYDVLHDAMKRAGTQSFKAGAWCQFCPRKLACPKMRKNAADVAMVGIELEKGDLSLTDVSDDWLGGMYLKTDTIRMFLKAMNDEVNRRARLGREHPAWKFIDAKTDREWKAEAVADKDALDTPMVPLLVQRFGDDAFTPREFKSPAQIEKLGAIGKDFVREFAQKPKAGQRVVPTTQPGKAVKPASDEETFALALTAAKQPAT
jgi:hypothetical protein